MKAPINQNYAIKSLELLESGSYGWAFVVSHKKGIITTTEDISKAKKYTRKGARIAMCRIRQYGHDYTMSSHRVGDEYGL